MEIAIEPRLQGAGLSGRLVAALHDNARLGFAEMVAPVRPNGKTDIDEPMADYACRTRADGLPAGPVRIEGALAPVMCDAEHGTAVYVEPNVWVRHPTGARGAACRLSGRSSAILLATR